MSPSGHQLFVTETYTLDEHIHFAGKVIGIVGMSGGSILVVVDARRACVFFSSSYLSSATRPSLLPHIQTFLPHSGLILALLFCNFPSHCTPLSLHIGQSEHLESAYVNVFLFCL